MCDLVPRFRKQGELSLEEAFGFILRHYLPGKPSFKMDRSNIKWWCMTTGSVLIHRMMDSHVSAHLARRERGDIGRKPASNQTRRHDIRVLATMLSVLTKWKHQRREFDGFRMERLLLPIYSPVKDVARPQATPRKNKVEPDVFSLYIEHASEAMKERLFFLNDFGQSPSDLKQWGPKNYDASIDAIRFVRRKTRHRSGKEVVLPVTDRCRPIILRAIAENRPRFLEWDQRDHEREVRRLRRITKRYFQLGRDLRKGLINGAIRAANNDIGPAQRIAGHSNPQTTLNHYYIDDGADLRPILQAHSNRFGGAGTVTMSVRPNLFSES